MIHHAPHARPYRLPATFCRIFAVVAVVSAASVAAATSGCATARVWVEDTQTLTIDAAQLRSLMVQSHNGDITVHGKPGATQIEAVIKARYGGSTAESAERCRQAVEIISATEADGEHKLLARFKEPRASDWQTEINFRVSVPERIAAKLVSHNGDIAVENIDGACSVSTHNGDVTVNAKSRSLRVVTHNGQARVSAQGEDMNITSHNGDIHLDATQCARVAGSVQTHNGGIIAKFGETTSAELDCATNNGSIRATAPWRVSLSSPQRTIGVIGAGESETRLRLQTHNGSISITK